jgi:hypothetical protein
MFVMLNQLLFQVKTKWLKKPIQKKPPARKGNGGRRTKRIKWGEGKLANLEA